MTTQPPPSGEPAAAPAGAEPAPGPGPGRRGVGYAVRDGVATVTLQRGDGVNALDLSTKQALLDAVQQAAADAAVRAVLLTGTGRTFCVGQDLREHGRLLADGDPALWTTVAEHYTPIAWTLATMPKPVVAGVNGVAAGAGAAFAMAADVRVVAESAGFNLAFAAVALSADSGCSWWLPRLVGTGRAMDLLLRPRTVPAAEALAIGLASEVVPDAELAGRASQVAVALAAGPTRAYAALRRAVAFSAGHDLADSLGHEGTLMADTGASADHAEAVQAFVTRRPPRFTGR